MRSSPHSISNLHLAPLLPTSHVATPPSAHNSLYINPSHPTAPSAPWTRAPRGISTTHYGLFCLCPCTHPSQAELTFSYLLYLANSTYSSRFSSETTYSTSLVTFPRERWWPAHLCCHRFKSIDAIFRLPGFKSCLHHSPTGSFEKVTYPLLTSVSLSENVGNHIMYNLALLKVYNKIMHIKFITMCPAHR